MKIREFLLKTLDDWPVKVGSLLAAVMIVFFYNINSLETRDFFIPLEYDIPENYITVETNHHAEDVHVFLKGKGLGNIRAKDITARIVVPEDRLKGNFTVKINREGEARKLNTLEIKVSPMSVSLKLEKVLSQKKEVYISKVGSIAHGYKIMGEYVTPNRIVVRGPRSRIIKMKKIRTENVDLLGRNEDFTIRVRLFVNDPLITLPATEIVEYYCIVDEIVEEHTFEDIDIANINVSNNIYLAASRNKGTIEAKGSLLFIEKLQDSDIGMVVDCSRINAPGVYKMSIKPKIPDELELIDFKPKEIVLEFYGSPVMEN